MGRPKKNKDPFAELPESFKDALATADVNQLKDKLAEVAKAQEANKSEMKADEDLNNLKEQVKVASSGYTEVTKSNKLKTKYVIRLLADKGDAVAQSIVQNDINAELQKSL